MLGSEVLTKMTLRKPNHAPTKSEYINQMWFQEELIQFFHFLMNNVRSYSATVLMPSLTETSPPQSQRSSGKHSMKKEQNHDMTETRLSTSGLPRDPLDAL